MDDLNVRYITIQPRGPSLESNPMSDTAVALAEPVELCLQFGGALR
jgi:hypothetical protein